MRAQTKKTIFRLTDRNKAILEAIGMLDGRNGNVKVNRRNGRTGRSMSDLINYCITRTFEENANLRGGSMTREEIQRQALEIERKMIEQQQVALGRKLKTIAASIQTGKRLDDVEDIERIDDITITDELAIIATIEDNPETPKSV